MTTIGVDVTDMTDKQIHALENASGVDGFVENGILFPQGFKNIAAPADRVYRLKDTKRNREVWGKYQEKGFTKDGSFNYKTWGDIDLIREISRRKDEGKKKTRTNFLRHLGEKKLIKIKEKLAVARNREETKTEITNAINKYLERGTPEAEARFKRRMAKKRVENIEKRKINKQKKIEKIERNIDKDAAMNA
jgi:hypothetical protein